MNGKALSGVSVSDAVCLSKIMIYLVGWTSVLLRLITFAAYGLCPWDSVVGIDVPAVKAAVKYGKQCVLAFKAALNHGRQCAFSGQ